MRAASYNGTAIAGTLTHSPAIGTVLNAGANRETLRGVYTQRNDELQHACGSDYQHQCGAQATPLSCMDSSGRDLLRNTAKCDPTQRDGDLQRE